jgi:hypothetical protein
MATIHRLPRDITRVDGGSMRQQGSGAAFSAGAYARATTTELKELWAKVTNERLQKTGDEGRAIREANSVVARQQGGSEYLANRPAR